MRLNIIFFLLLASLPLRTFAGEGLAVEFRQAQSPDRRDHLVLPFPALYIDTRHAPTPLLQPGPFEAHFTGWISVDLRAQYTFTAELDGKLELILNGKEILTAAPENESSATSKPVRLNKGTNSFIARFSSPLNRPATLRILWASKNHPVPVPIPASVLSHDPTDQLKESLARQNGAFLFDQYRCSKCHLPGGQHSLDAPAFEGIGSRLNPGWVARWILDPASHREARMPALLRGPDAARQAEAIAAFLSQLKGTAPAQFEPTENLASTGTTLFEELHCASCHTSPSSPAAPDRFSLNHVAEKFAPMALAEFLQNPHSRYTANPMPNFHLTSPEAHSLAAFLLRRAPAGKTASIASDLASLGKSLLQTTGCLNCHSLELENRFSAPALAKLHGKLDGGCLSSNSPNSPRFTFKPGEVDEIRSYLASEHTQPNTFLLQNATRYVQSLRCTQCHEDSALPNPISLGAKLKPEWTARFISGDISYKPRPWLQARMPAFPAYATNLAAGLAALHGHAPISPTEPAPEPNLVSLGAKLISSAGGFSCVACHPVGSSSIAQVVESPGVNLAYSGERLLPSFFRRWLMNPIAIDPSTKMPAYFDAEARSQLTEFFDGDAHQQINAMWHYIRLGDKMPPPPTP